MLNSHVTIAELINALTVFGFIHLVTWFFLRLINLAKHLFTPRQKHIYHHIAGGGKARFKSSDVLATTIMLD